MLNFVRNLGTLEIIIIVLLLIVFFGSKRISKLAKHAGESTKELKKAKKEYDNTVKDMDKKPLADNKKKKDDDVDFV